MKVRLKKRTVVVVLLMAIPVIAISVTNEVAQDRRLASPRPGTSHVAHAPDARDLTGPSPNAAAQPYTAAPLARTTDKKSITRSLVFAEGGVIEVTFRLWPDPGVSVGRLSDDYQRLAGLAKTGDSSAALTLHRGLERCRRAFRSAAELEREIDVLHQTWTFRTPDLDRRSRVQGGDEAVADIERMLRETQALCAGVTADQIERRSQWLTLAAAQGDLDAIALLAERETDAARRTELARRLWEGGHMAGLTYLAEDSLAHASAHAGDMVSAYAYAYAEFRLWEAYYVDGGPISQRVIARKREQIEQIGLAMSPSAQDAAIERAAQILKQNPHCCYL